MASMMGYIVTIIGLSIILGFLGVNTIAGGFMGMIGCSIDNPANGLSAITCLDLNTLDMPYFATLAIIIGGLLVVGSLALSAKFDLGASLKIGAAVIFLPIALNEFRNVWNYASSIEVWSGVIQVVTAEVYIPLIAGFAITLYNWIGGNN